MWLGTYAIILIWGVRALSFSMILVTRWEILKDHAVLLKKILPNQTLLNSLDVVKAMRMAGKKKCPAQVFINPCLIFCS